MKYSAQSLNMNVEMIVEFPFIVIEGRRKLCEYHTRLLLLDQQTRGLNTLFLTDIQDYLQYKY